MTPQAQSHVHSSFEIHTEKSETLTFLAENLFKDPDAEDIFSGSLYNLRRMHSTVRQALGANEDQT